MAHKCLEVWSVPMLIHEVKPNSNAVLLSENMYWILYTVKVECVCAHLLACVLLCNYIHCRCSEQKSLEHIKACGCKGVGEACLS